MMLFLLSNITDSSTYLIYYTILHSLKTIDHPGVAAHRLGKHVTIVNYKNEMTKMSGLADAISSSSPEENRVLNLEAFRALQETLVMLKEKNNGRVHQASSAL